MYSIQFSDWGLVLEFIGTIQPEVMHDWLTDVRQLTDGFIEPFSVIVDIQQARPAVRTVEEPLLQGLFALEQAGMKRVAVVVDEGGNIRWRCLNAAQGPRGLRRFVTRPDADWLVQVHAWVQHGTDPQSDETTKRTES